MTAQEFQMRGFVLRIEKLEKQRRWMRQVGVFAFLFTISAFLLAQTPSRKVVEADEFVLRDMSGAMRARLFMSTSGPTFALFDSNQQPRIVIASYGDVSKIGILNASGESEVGLGSLTDGPIFVLTNGKGNASAQMSFNEGRPYLNLLDGYGKIRTALALTPMGPSMRLFDKNEKALASLAIQDEGPTPEPSLLLGTPDARPYVSLIGSKSGGDFRILDGNGKEIFGIPR